MINSFIFCKVFVKEGWTNRDTGKVGDPRLQYNQFMLLQEVMAQYAKKLTIKLDIDRLKADNIKELKDTLVSFKGKQPLHFVVYEMQEAIKVNMISRKRKVQITSELLTELEAREVPYKLN
jgi:DNA polymerase-3 subunit alpha